MGDPIVSNRNGKMEHPPNLSTPFYYRMAGGNRGAQFYVKELHRLSVSEMTIEPCLYSVIEIVSHKIIATTYIA